MPREARVAFLVSSCDAYRDLWDTFFNFLFENWADCPYNIYLLSNYKSYHHPRVKMITVGDDVSYADNLRSALKEIDAEWILLWLDDVFINQPVDNHRLSRILNYAEGKSTPFVQLFPELPVSYEKTQEDIGLIPRGVKYRSAVGINFIKKDLLWDLARPGMTAWDMDKSTLMDEMGVEVYGLTRNAAKNPPIQYLHAVAKGKWIRANYRKLAEAGLGDVLAGRQVQSIWSHLYMYLYLSRSYAFKITSRYWR